MKIKAVPKNLHLVRGRPLLWLVLFIFVADAVKGKRVIIFKFLVYLLFLGRPKNLTSGCDDYDDSKQPKQNQHASDRGIGPPGMVVERLAVTFSEGRVRAQSFVFEKVSTVISTMESKR